MKEEEIGRLKKVGEEHKETIKKLNSHFKDLELMGTDEKGKILKLS
jgi:hypothetical protein